jgi:hypothetical protein
MVRPSRQEVDHGVSALDLSASFVTASGLYEVLRGDPLAAVPLVLASITTLVRPAAWRRFATDTVTNHALTPSGWQQIVDVAAAL